MFHLFMHLFALSPQAETSKLLTSSSCFEVLVSVFTFVFLSVFVLTKTMDTMSSFHSLLPPSSTPPLVLLLLLTSLLPHTALSQTPSGFGTSPPGPTMADCGTHLLPLVPCAPFVQGTAPSPAQSCCDGLIQLNNQQPACLCLLLNNSDALSSFPINSTLALELPLLCNLQLDTSSCSGVRAPSSPVSQVSPGVLPNGSIIAADTPGVTVAPKTSITEFGYGRSGSTKLNMKGYMVVLVAATAFMSLDVQPSLGSHIYSLHISIA